MLGYEDDKLSKTGKKKMNRKSRSRKCFDLLEKVKNYGRKRRRWRIGRVDEENNLTFWKK
jgi:hypothetical protein